MMKIDGTRREYWRSIIMLIAIEILCGIALCFSAVVVFRRSHFFGVAILGVAWVPFYWASMMYRVTKVDVEKWWPKERAQ